jgi:transglutaminase-like putative cysteine protease
MIFLRFQSKKTLNCIQYFFMRYFILLFAFITAINANAQYAVDGISKSLKENANAVIRYQETTITLEDFDVMTTYERVVVTVLNRDGMFAVRSYAAYDDDSSIKEIKAYVYDGNGEQIEKFKERDFTDRSASSGDLYSDNRIKSIDYFPNQIPFTFEFISETKSKSTAFLPQWDPSPFYGVSTQKSVYKIINNKEVPLLSKKYNLEKFGASVREKPSLYEYEIENVPAVEQELMSPHYTQFTPVVKLALKQFRLAGQNVSISSWEDFGKWMNEQLLNNRDELPQETINEVENLVEGVTEPKEKARIIYEYMQNKTRYISVQVGIGGWQPSPAKDVDKLGYGDCKALTNYTKALLKTQDIDSYYTIVIAGAEKRDIDEEFIAVQGNHVILTVPLEEENLFLECTSQRAPFNYLGDFTDDRKVIMITNDGSVVKNTKAYPAAGNIQRMEAKITVRENQSLGGSITQTSEGILYGDKYELDNKESDVIEKYYKETWSQLNNLDLSEINFDNNKTDVVFTENISFEATNYISKAGDRLLLAPNIFNRLGYITAPKKERSQKLLINRGKAYDDSIEITLPEGYEVEAMFNPIEINTEFGSYLAKVEELGASKIKYSRKFSLFDGEYEKEKYSDFVAFINAITKEDSNKIVLVKRE